LKVGPRGGERLTPRRSSLHRGKLLTPREAIFRKRPAPVTAKRSNDSLPQLIRKTPAHPPSAASSQPQAKTAKLAHRNRFLVDTNRTEPDLRPPWNRHSASRYLSPTKPFKEFTPNFFHNEEKLKSGQTRLRSTTDFISRLAGQRHLYRLWPVKFAWLHFIKPFWALKPGSPENRGNANG